MKCAFAPLSSATSWSSTVDDGSYGRSCQLEGMPSPTDQKQSTFGEEVGALRLRTNLSHEENLIWHWHRHHQKTCSVAGELAEWCLYLI